MQTQTEPVRVDSTSTVPEYRTRPLGGSDFTLRAEEAGPVFSGHAAVFNSRTAIGNPLSWGWYEEVAASAFDKTLTESDVRMLVDHESRLLVARMTAGDLRLHTDEVGLAAEADLDEQLSYVRDLVRNLEKRRITGMSFGFFVVKDAWSQVEVEGRDGGTATAELRVLQEVRLVEVSAVTFPAYDMTDAGLRAMTAEVRATRTPDFSPAQRETPEPPDSTPAEADGPPAGTRTAAALLARHHDLAKARRTQR